MAGNRQSSFSYPWWHVGRPVPALFMVGGILTLATVGGSTVATGAEGFLLWLGRLFLVGLLALIMYVFYRGFVEPHTISVTDAGVVGRPLLRSTLTIRWDEIESARVVRGPESWVDNFITRGQEFIRISGGTTGKILVAERDLRGYDQLRDLLLSEMQSRGTREQPVKRPSTVFFSYSMLRVWHMASVVILVGSAVGAAAMFGVGGGGVLAAGWGFFALNVYLLARLLWTEQHAFAVTDSDIGTKTQTGKWTTVTWGEIGSAMETSTGRRSRVTVRAVDGRPLIAFNSDLSRYGELKELVLTKVQRQGRPAG